MKKSHITGLAIAAAFVLYTVPAYADVSSGSSGNGTSYGSSTGRPTSASPHETTQDTATPGVKDDDLSQEQHSGVKTDHHHHKTTNTSTRMPNANVPNPNDNPAPTPAPGPGPAAPH